jgi:hypothetical protein
MQFTVSRLLTPFHRLLQAVLFPAIEVQLGPLSESHRQLVRILTLVEVESLVLPSTRGVGRPARHRRAIARAFVAKAVFNLATTRQLLDRLLADDLLRRLCGWESAAELPHESQFSRAFAEFAASQLPQRMHAALIAATQKERLIGHISRDSTAIEVREKPAPAAVEIKPVAADKRKPGRPKRGEIVPPPEPRRIDRQREMTLEQMLDELPRLCNAGAKRNSKGYTKSWIGYKLHIDAADGQIPISCILTSASLHDSQAAIPLAEMTARRVTNLYDLMDSAYDAEAIHLHLRSLGRVAIIDRHPHGCAKQKAELEAEQRRRRLLAFSTAEDLRYRERTTVERVNARLKDEFGGRTVRVRGHLKVMCHLMFGILALTANQILRLIPPLNC